MKKKYSLTFLEELKRIPNVSLACEKVGLSRNTVYRWCKEDSAFKKQVDEALIAGVDSVNDLAESKLVSHINNGNLRAIQYWLDNHKKEYVRPRPKDLWSDALPHVGSIVITRVDNEVMKEHHDALRKMGLPIEEEIPE
jgi:hypothetical protein